MNKLVREFVSHDDRRFAVKVGSHLASSLSGFLAGAAVATIVWLAGWALIRFLPDLL